MKNAYVYFTYFTFDLGRQFCEKFYNANTSWVLLFFVVFWFLYHQCRYHFYNFQKLYSTLFEIEKIFLTDSDNPFNCKNLLNVFFVKEPLAYLLGLPTKLS